MFQARSVCLLLALCLLAMFLAGCEARPQEGREEGGDQEVNVEAEEKDLEGAASFGYGYYASPYLGGYYGGYWPHYSGSYYGIGYPYYGGYGGYYGHHHHGHYGHYF
ncbi:pupal cuticle protein Edg-91 [Drosophila biarmipes]|uniref:pupal cuticle protein Edg-91 n=1 Tax=Drosophila biarmipes TaxID=125945 RepID=UPI0007E78607|nr:pupal cuticle protein Edg-91 [Drosophila biarmipes]